MSPWTSKLQFYKRHTPIWSQIDMRAATVTMYESRVDDDILTLFERVMKTCICQSFLTFGSCSKYTDTGQSFQRDFQTKYDRSAQALASRLCTDLAIFFTDFCVWPVVLSSRVTDFSPVNSDFSDFPQLGGHPHASDPLGNRARGYSANPAKYPTSGRPNFYR